MKKIVTASLVAALAVTSVQAESLSAQLSSLEADVAKLKKDLKKQKKKLNEVKAHDSGDNIKWGADIRTAIDSISYTTADGTKYEKNDLMSLRLWLNMAYAPDQNNVFKGQLSMNKAFGASFAMPSQFSAFDWTSNEALTDNSLKVRQAYWLYLGESAFGLDMPWTFSVGRRPSTNGFLANLRDDDPAQSPLGHIINVEFDGLSSKLDLSKVTGVAGMSIKLCMGQGSTNAMPLIGSAAPSANDDMGLDDIKLAGFIFEPYNDGQFITKATWFRAYDLPGLVDGAIGAPDGQPDYVGTPPFAALLMDQYGDMEGGAFSVLIDGLTEDGILSETKVFGSIAYSKTRPDATSQMLGMWTPAGLFGADVGESKTGTSYWLGAQVPLFDGKFGLEYNHGSKYWRPFTYAEDTMIGSKLAARGDAWEVYYTYNFSEALSAQIRYTEINYDYTGSNGFFGGLTGTPLSMDEATMLGAGDQAVEKARDARFYIRYRF